MKQFAFTVARFIGWVVLILSVLALANTHPVLHSETYPQYLGGGVGLIVLSMLLLAFTPRKKYPKNALVATLLSFMVVGLGQVYLGRWQRGLLFLGIAMVFGWILILLKQSVFYSALLLNSYSAVDAVAIAKGNPSPIFKF